MTLLISACFAYVFGALLLIKKLLVRKLEVIRESSKEDYSSLLSLKTTF